MRRTSQPKGHGARGSGFAGRRGAVWAVALVVAAAGRILAGPGEIGAPGPVASPAVGQAAGAAGPLSEVHLLLGGRLRPGTWTGVRATVEAKAAEVRGTLSAAVGPARYVKPLAVLAGTRRTCLLPVFIPAGVPPPRVTFEAGGFPAVPLDPSYVEVPAGELLIGVDPARGAAEGMTLPLREALSAGRAVHWIPVTWAEVQEIPELLDGLDGLVGVDAPPSIPLPLDAHVGVWLGRGGGFFRDAKAARDKAGAGWVPPPRAAAPVPNDLFPRAGWAAGRIHRGRIALGILLALGAAALAVRAWAGRSRRAAAAALLGCAAAGLASVAALMPAGDVSARGAAVREIVFSDGAAPRRAVEAAEGFVAVDAGGAADLRVTFPPRTRVSVAAVQAATPARESVEIEPRDGGWTARWRLDGRGRRTFRFSRHGPATEDIRFRVSRQAGRPVRVEYENAFEQALEGPALIDGAAVYPLDAIPSRPAVGARAIAAGADDWPAFLRRSWEMGDPRRALWAWWGNRPAGRTWLIGTVRGGAPFDFAAGGAPAIDWGPVVAAARAQE